MRKPGDDLEPFPLDQEHIDLLHRGRVADAFIDVVCERGYQGATVSDVAARAVMSSRTFYRLYTNKADAFVDVHARLRARATRRMHAAMAAHDDPREQVCAALQAVLAYVDEHPRWGRVFVDDGPAGDGASAPLYLAAIQEWLDAIADLLPESVDMTRFEQGAAACGILRARLADGTRRASELLPALTQVLLGERVDHVAEPPLDRLVGVPPALTWDTLVQALLDHDVETLDALRRRAEASLDDGGGEAHPAELAAMVQAASVGRNGGTAAVLALVGHGTGDGLPSRQSLRCLRYVAAHPGTSGRGVLAGLGFRNESQVSRLMAGLAARALVDGTRAAGGPRAWTITARGEELLRTLGLLEERVERVDGAAPGESAELEDEPDTPAQPEPV